MTEQEKKESLTKQIIALLSNGAEMTSSQIQNALGGAYRATDISRALTWLRAKKGVIVRREVEREGALGPKKVWANKLAENVDQEVREAA